MYLPVWLRPSKQIRAPLYSIKQKRQRRWIVIKYGLVYVLAFAIFAALLAVREYQSLPFATSSTNVDPLQRWSSVKPSRSTAPSARRSDGHDISHDLASPHVSHRLVSLYALDGRSPAPVLAGLYPTLLSSRNGQSVHAL